MRLEKPVLTKRIPTWPWGDPKDRHIVGIDESEKTRVDIDRAVDRQSDIEHVYFTGKPTTGLENKTGLQRTEGNGGIGRQGAAMLFSR